MRRGRIYGLVAKAIAAGRLPVLDGSIRCTDCPNPAAVYDHRDYDKPLEVEAVCVGCNVKRGRAANWLEARSPEGRQLRSICLRAEVAEWVQAIAEDQDRSFSYMVNAVLEMERHRLSTREAWRKALARKADKKNDDGEVK